MMNAGIARLHEPRAGIVLISAAVALLMAVHWAPMALPGVAVLGLGLARPQIASSRAVWWVMAGVWLTAVVVAEHRMEDHVYLFAVWLVAVAVALHQRNDDAFVAHAAWHARMLIGVTFTAAVAWKLYFGEFVTGVTLWVFILTDSRFGPLATLVGLSGNEVARDRAVLSGLLAGTVDSMQAEMPSAVMWRIMAVAVVTLILEAVVALSHLMPDSSRLAALRVPSVVVFAVVTYVVVPVVPFAALLALLTMAAARWRREALWVFPVLMIVSGLRLLMIS